MNTAQLCPVCMGKGKLPPERGESDEPAKTCHGCCGRGWVEVGNDCQPQLYFPQPTPTPTFYTNPYYANPQYIPDNQKLKCWQQTDCGKKFPGSIPMSHTGIN